MKSKYSICITFLFINLSIFAQTQAEMTRDAMEEYKQTDKELNNVYQSILTEYEADTLFIYNLKSSQRLWIQFRDAEMAMKYPNYPENSYGTMYLSCSALYLTELTEKRITTLSQWLKGAEEGDACNGSVKTN